MNRLRILSLFVTVLVITIAGIAMSFFARGYKFDPKKFVIKPTGILVVTSSPDGAQILVNGALESATNATISLVPETYDVEVKKEGFMPWKKRLDVKKEEVTKVDAALFPIAPSLSAVTFNGAINPVVSPDGTKVLFGIPSEDSQKVGLWVMELGNLPIGFSNDPRRISNLDPTNASWTWSPDSREILITIQTAKYILPSGGFTPQYQLVNIQGAKLEKTFAEWKTESSKKMDSSLSRLPEKLQEIFKNKTDNVTFSPDNNKVLYTASGSATIPDNLIPQLPGSSTQKQERVIKDGQTYVYDIKEDRNFLISDQKIKTDSSTIAWFPTSNHLLLAENNKITIMDYDGTNRQVIWNGPYDFPYAVPYPNSSRLLMLTKLGSGNSLANLYAVILK